MRDNTASHTRQPAEFQRTNILQATVAHLLHPSHARQLPAPVRRVVYAFASLIGAYHVLALSLWYAPTDFHSVAHLTSILAPAFLLRTSSNRQGPGLRVEGIVLACLSLTFGVFFLYDLPTLVERVMVISPLSGGQIAMAAALMLLLLEATRRVVGLPFVLIIGLFLLLMGLGPHLPGPWAHPGMSVVDLFEVLVWTRLDGIWGLPLRICATLIALFFIFGKLVQYSGLGTLLASLCQALAGAAKGGPARAAVISSAIVGSVTGGPATNLAITGSFTIPLMRQAGYQPHFAGGIEAAASTGASIVPPIMTGVVFIMAELTGTPLVNIMLMALIPATLYYACLLLQVHYRAIKMDLAAGPGSVDFAAAHALLARKGHLLLPVVLVITLLVSGMYPVTAVAWAIPAVPLAAAIRKETRMKPRDIMSSLADAAGDLIRVTPVCALSGIVIVGLFQTGLGSTFSHYVSVAAGQSQLLLILLGAFACLLLGTGVPAIPAYLMTVLIVAPLMVQSGTPLVAAHMFSLYYANMAFITPPIAVGAFVAAGLVGTGFWRISLVALRLAIIGFVIPAAFVYRPALLLLGGPIDILWAVAAAAGIVVCLASAMEGWMVKKLDGASRLLLAAAGLALVPPILPANAGALIVLLLVFLRQRWTTRTAHT